MGRNSALSSTRIRTTRFLIAAGLSVAATVGFAGPATAAPPDHANAGGHTSSHTEDTDTNDNTPNNVVDAGDNAHPSGRDRSTEAGGSGNQGKAQADPDDDTRGPERSNGGVDQPNGGGGRDKADQDGNNGCGNDDDFEDDNEGRCGAAKKAPKAQTAPPAPKPTKATPPPAAADQKHTCSTRAVGNGNGANGSGAYGSTCDGSPSQNGNGGGHGGGKPCAGCVGNADDKNPPGQRPNGNDRNAGYECDRNHGVGRGNPAHSGCTSATTTPTTKPPKKPPVETPPAKTPPANTPPNTPNNPVAVVAGVDVTAPTTATSSVAEVRNPDAVLGTDVAATETVVAQATAAPTPGLLARTGLDLIKLVGLAVTVLGAGAAAIVARRRTR